MGPHWGKIYIFFVGCLRVSIRRGSPTTLLSDTRRATKSRWEIHENIIHKVMIKTNHFTQNYDKKTNHKHFFLLQGFLKHHPSLTSLITHHSVMPELLPVRKDQHYHSTNISDQQYHNINISAIYQINITTISIYQ